MSDAPIMIVDEDDKPIGSASKEEAQEKGLIHRIIHVMVEDPNGNILLQKRGLQSKIHPGWWDPAVGGHVDEGEDYLTAAKREMQEEIGLTDVRLVDLGNHRGNSTIDGRKLNRFYQTFKVVVPVTTEFKAEPREVAELRWFSPSEVKELTASSDEVTGPLIEILKRYY